MAAFPSALAGVGLRKTLLVLRAVGRPRRPWQAALLRHVSGKSNSADLKYPGIVESTEEYKFVERLIPPTTVPVPPKHDQYPTPSGWRPPQDLPPDLSYFVRRSRMHNVPVYKDTSYRGSRKMTIIRKIEGDIWALENDVKGFLTELSGQTPATQVNENTCSIRVKGYFEQELKTWLMDKGF
ncbi:39S ribosomal protein L49, mitochondrial [Protobothrops mucrosquamatus]|uniref:39S ribosomal protein L49, mitochondrial n=1 Tax=Protobothrops mucrosquamatus TaxID=103944 RepID=UPI000775F258|nr:39S ribosomal protein L49, mitochondrial [Protobothrops mucrosquamatus]